MMFNVIRPCIGGSCLARAGRCTTGDTKQNTIFQQSMLFILQYWDYALVTIFLKRNNCWVPSCSIEVLGAIFWCGQLVLYQTWPQRQVPGITVGGNNHFLHSIVSVVLVGEGAYCARAYHLFWSIDWLSYKSWPIMRRQHLLLQGVLGGRIRSKSPHCTKKFLKR